jgi:hypothetical protein
MYRITPSLNSPALLSPLLPLLQIGKLPKMMHGIQLPNLDKPSADTFHDFTSCFQALAPVCFPFEEISGMQSIGAELEEAAELARWCGRPEGEFLHEGDTLGSYEFLEGFVEGGEVGVLGDGVERGVVAVIALVFPDVNWIC